MQRYDVIIAKEAWEQLSNCILFLAADAPDAAQELRIRLIEAIRSLESMPGRYPFMQSRYLPANRYHKMFVRNYYLILYQIRDQTVLVDYVVDCRQDHQWLLHP